MVLVIYIMFKLSDNDWESISNIDMIYLTNDIKKFYYNRIINDFFKEFNTRYTSHLISKTSKNKIKYGSLKLIYESYLDNLINIFNDTISKVSYKYYLLDQLVHFYHFHSDVNLL